MRIILDTIFARRSWWRQIQTTILLIAVICAAISLHAGQSRNDQTSPAFKQRAMNAAEQLRDYHQRISTSVLKRLRDPSSARKDVEIKIDREAKTSSTIFYYDNVESGVNGWTTQAYTGSDIWHQSTLNSASATHSWWPGIEIQSNYNNGAPINDALISPAISLAGAGGPIRLLFAENFVTELGWDYCMVDVSTDGGTSWTPLRGVYGTAPTGDTHGWQVTSLDLSAYSGQTVNLRFYFDTGDANFNEFPGWFVDDIIIFDQGGTITGRKFFDVNNNSIKDVGERGVKDWFITAAGPVTITTRTNYRGRYWFTLPLGSYQITETFQPNWTQKYPLSGHWDIDLTTPDTLVDSIHFGNYTQASFIKGIKFNDINRNAVNDEGDSVIGEWKIVLADSNGIELDFDRTDSTGLYELFVFQPGRYIVREQSKLRWVQTYPPAESYTIDIPDLNTTVIGRDFGNYYSDSANTIMGQKFEDLDKNHIKDAHEPGIPNFKIRLSGAKSRTATTDSNGYYRFEGLPAGTYRVKEVPTQGWWQSRPDSFYTVVCYQGQFIDTLDFGNYQIIPGFIGGMKFEDADNSGSKETGETGLSGWQILINGVTYFNTSVNQSSVTDGSGNYSFPGLWPGTYTLSEVWRNGWTQTYPANLGVHHINLGVEENRTGVDFGNIDSVLTIGTFRSFLSESLAFAVDGAGKHIPVKVKPNGVDFEFDFYWPSGSIPVNLKLIFSQATSGVLSGMNYVGGLPVFHDNLASWTNAKEIIVPLAPDGDSAAPILPYVHVNGHGIKGKPATLKYRWIRSGVLLSKGVLPGLPANPIDSIRTMYLTYPMPDAVNLLEKVGFGLRVGLGGPHSVVHGRYQDIIKSLFMKPDRQHIGVPRCIDNFEGVKPRPIKKQQKYLTPSKHNNKLFAEAIALQVNILGSDNGYTPAGFGNLIFDEGTGGLNPMNGMPIRTIAAVLDSFMSSPVDTGLAMHGCQMPASFGGMDPETLYAKIRKINGAFSGPLDTITFFSGLSFKGVHQLSEVPFLRYDPVMAFKSFSTLPPPGQYMPEEYALYQNFPNPFNPTTTIAFTLSQTSFVTLKIYNMLGQEVATLLSRESMEDGSQEIDFEANNLPSGVYFYHLVAQGIPEEDEGTVESFSAVKKMLLVK